MDGTEKTYQVCDDVCLQMFRLQNVMYDTTHEGKKKMNQQKALEFIHEYLKE